MSGAVAATGLLFSCVTGRSGAAARWDMTSQVMPAPTAAERSIGNK
jgi:hypothetical protein